MPLQLLSIPSQSSAVALLTSLVALHCVSLPSLLQTKVPCVRQGPSPGAGLPSSLKHAWPRKPTTSAGGLKGSSICPSQLLSLPSHLSGVEGQVPAEQ